MNYTPTRRRTTPDGFSEKRTKSVQCFLNYELLFELNDENIRDVGYIFRTKVKRGLLCYA